MRHVELDVAVVARKAADEFDGAACNGKGLATAALEEPAENPPPLAATPYA